MKSEERNGNTIEIIDWEKLRKHENFTEAMDKVDSLLKQEHYREALDATITNFLAEELRVCGVKGLVLKKAKQACEGYLKEEMAIQLILAEKNYAYVAYPRAGTPAIMSLYEADLIPKGTLKYIVLRTKEKKNTNADLNQEQINLTKEFAGKVNSPTSPGNLGFFGIGFEQKANVLPRGWGEGVGISVGFTIAIQTVSNLEGVDPEIKVSILKGMADNYMQNFNQFFGCSFNPNPRS